MRKSITYLVIKYFLLSVFSLLFSTFMLLGQTSPGGFKRIVLFDVTSDSLKYERQLDKSLLLVVEKVSYLGIEKFGWEVTVIKRNNRLFNKNLLYHSDQWHGPYPTQFFLIMISPSSQE